MVCDMKKAFVLLGLVFCISGCSLNENDNDMDSAYESLDNEEKAIGGDVDEVYDLLESSKITIPKYFKNKEFKIDGIIISAVSNGRYYIFRAPKGIDTLVEGEMYIYESFDSLTMKYNPDLMCGDGKMDDTEIRGEYRPGEIEFQFAKTRLNLEDIPYGFEPIVIDNKGYEIPGWTDGRYYIYKAVYKEYEDWYICDKTDNSVIRYEPSFMTGKAPE